MAFTRLAEVLRLLPVENPRELVQFRMEGGHFGNQNGDGVHTFSYPLYNAFATETRSSRASLVSRPPRSAW